MSTELDSHLHDAAEAVATLDRLQTAAARLGLLGVSNSWREARAFATAAHAGTQRAVADEAERVSAGRLA